MDLSALIKMSRKYGSDPDFVLAGGGNTSYKEGGIMAVKASGFALGVIDEDGFVPMDTEKLRALAKAAYPEDDKEREALALKDMMAARLDCAEDKRPSVECILHALFRQSYVLHAHPALINGLTCGLNGAADAAELFSDIDDKVLWLPLTKPGFTLSKICAELFGIHEQNYGRPPSILLIQNHGIFVAADTAEEAGIMMEDAMARVSGRVKRYPCMEEYGAAAPEAAEAARKAAELYGGSFVFLNNIEIARFTESREAYGLLMKPFTPDHIVYCRAYPLFADSADELESAFSEYGKAYGGKPKIAAVRGLGVIALGADPGEASRAAELYLDAIKIAVYSGSFGGPLALPDEFTDFIVNWESESYRQKKAE